MASDTQLCGKCKHLIDCGFREWRCRMYPLKGEGSFKMLAYSIRDTGGGVMEGWPTRHWKCKGNNMFEEASE